MDDQSLINGLLAKRTELLSVNAELGERMAVVANEIEAVDGFSTVFGDQGEIVTMPCAIRIVLIYRDEL